MAILFFRGVPAFTRFQLDKINAELAGGELLAAHQLILAEVEGLDQAVLAGLESLLRAKHVRDLEIAAHQEVIAPRAGTLSPWSSKATDIVRGCGLGSVVRVELATLLDFSRRPATLPHALFDRMVQDRHVELATLRKLFEHPDARPLREVNVLDGGAEELARVNQAWSLALSDEEIRYLVDACRAAQRNPSDAELMMFAQANSEHCRHKIFKADWLVDDQARDRGLFDMIRMSYQASPKGVLTAYSDNAAVLEAGRGTRTFPGSDGRWADVVVDQGMMIKVETHNHPTAIAPFPGAATGSGGEIRDEAATGRGAKPKAGLAGFSVSHLRIPNYHQPWEGVERRPGRIASPLEIMLEGPLGAAAFNNEFGRPALGGYFRTLECNDPIDPALRRGYHKPIMIAGGMGAIDAANVRKGQLAPGDKVLVLGGPAMLIGLGGGAASSVTSGYSSEDLDFASVQRDNPEMQRRCQEVIDRAAAMGADNPIVAIHDVGAGGLSNAVPELLHDSGRGGRIDMDAIPAADSALSAMELWCNESQERYVLGIAAEHLDAFLNLCERERCPVAVLGEATEAKVLLATRHGGRERAIDMPMETLFGNTPGMVRVAQTRTAPDVELTLDATLADMVTRVLSMPAVASKKFLITIGDRTVGGLVARDQMVGRWQVPVADHAMTLRDFHGYAGEAMAMGERTPLALVNGPASGRMAVAEAITNLAAAPIGSLGNIKLSANWMAAAGDPQEDAELYATVRAVGETLCPQLGIAIPVGKDSLSMRTVWEDDTGLQRMQAPLSLIVTGFAPVSDVRLAVTPELRLDEAPELWLIDLGAGKDRLGCSTLAQAFGLCGSTVPDIDDPRRLKGFFELVQQALQDELVVAYHDRSDGGLFATLVEMAFASRLGLDITVEGDVAAALFAEEAGAVVQVAKGRDVEFRALLARHGLADLARSVATIRKDETVRVLCAGKVAYESSVVDLERLWARTSHEMQKLRDHPDCAQEEFDALLDRTDPGLTAELTFEPEQGAPTIGGTPPTVAILREQGVNGQVEMAAAFMAAGFRAVDVHMSDLVAGRHDLASFQGIAACGGFSFGDVLGAGRGWASSIRLRDDLRQMFGDFFARTDRFALGVCNGCQMLSHLSDLIPGADEWPSFEPNRSARFEARLAMVEVLDSPSIFLSTMIGSRIPVVVSHAEGRARFRSPPRSATPALRFVDGRGHVAERFPANVNGSDFAVTGVTNEDGRITAMMPHPERVFRTSQFSWAPAQWGAASPWLQMFVNARRWMAQS